MSGAAHIKNNIPKLRFSSYENDWQERRLENIVSFNRGRGLSKNDVNKEGHNSCILYGELYTKYGEVITKVISKTNVSRANSLESHKDDLLIPSSGEEALDIARVSCLKEEGTLLGGDINVLRKIESISGEFFAYYLTSYQKRNIAKLAQGNSVVHLHASHLKKLKIHIPDFLEQQKIADFLQSVDLVSDNQCPRK